ncbi:phospholipid transporting ATPase, partial [Spiromyces aspiralis]
LLFDDSGAGGSVGGGLGSGISVQQDGDSLDVWAEVEWRHIYIGDICLLRDGDAVPADMVILSSSEGNDAECYVETKNLDGETNLKLKRGLRATANLDVAQLRHLPFIVCSEGPSSNLYTYKGTFEPAPSDSSSSSSSTTTTMIPAQKEAIYVDNLLLRGSV